MKEFWTDFSYSLHHIYTNKIFNVIGGFEWFLVLWTFVNVVGHRSPEISWNLAIFLQGSLSIHHQDYWARIILPCIKQSLTFIAINFLSLKLTWWLWERCVGDAKNILRIFRWRLRLLLFCWWVSICGTWLYFHERSYNENSTPSRPLWEVKSHLAWSVVRWVTTCEARVLFVFVLFWFTTFYFYCLSFHSTS